MAKLNWNAPGTRFYERGIDQGTLYIGEKPGVAWSGLVSVNESPIGGAPRPYYLDGYKYLNIASSEEFEATIEAFSSPIEFSACDGVGEIHNGLFATQQPRKPFSLSYRSTIGNDLTGKNTGYKIHIVYNALAAPSEKNHKTLSDDASLDPYSWHITTRPPKLSGRRPTAHFVIDSRYTPTELLSDINDILYGSDELMPRLLSADELVEMFVNWS